jgi:ATP-dependent Clp protease ATP-binding subunit ClpC
MPKVNVYLPDELADAVRDAQVPVSAVCQAALERAVRDVSSARAFDVPPDDDARAVGLFARFTPRARRALQLATQAARERPEGHVGTEHLLVGVIDEGSNLAVKVLAALDVEPADLRAEVVASMEAPATRASDEMPFTPLGKLALEEAAKEAMTLFHNYLGCEHLLLGLLATEEGVASQVMRRMGLELRTTRRAVVTALAGLMHAQATAPPATPATATSDDATTLQQILRRLDEIERRLAD